MKYTKTGRAHKYEFDSCADMLKFIEETNRVEGMNRNTSHESSYRNDSYYGTKSFDEAKELMIYGDNTNAVKLNQKVNTSFQISNTKTSKSFYSVCGYQASVPRYMQGIPTSMINSKKVVKKFPVVNVVKMIDYACLYSASDIIDYSTKALQIVKAIEEKGTRVNLSVMSVCHCEHAETLITVVKIKNAEERMNVSKIAFAMINPSMLRRMFFAIIERTKFDVRQSRWNSIYGTYEMPMDEARKYIKDQDILLPRRIEKVEDFLKNF